MKECYFHIGNVVKYNGNLCTVISVKSSGCGLTLCPFNTCNSLTYITKEGSKIEIECDCLGGDEDCFYCGGSGVLDFAFVRRIDQVEKIADNIDDFIMKKLKNIFYNQ